MAKVITVEKNQPLKPFSQNKKNGPKRPPLFKKFNFILMGIGVVLVVIGYICLVGGAPESPEQFNPEVFSTRRITVSTIFILLGLLTEIVAIMYHPGKKNSQTETTTNL